MELRKTQRGSRPLHMVEGVTMLNSRGSLTFDEYVVDSIDLPRTGYADIMRRFQETGVLLLEGGMDINPALYGEENIYSSYNDALDLWEKHLYHVATEMNIPVFGICRGHQLMAALNGGTLHQDIRGCLDVAHSAGPLRLSGIFAEWYPGGYTANSLHHQAINQVPPNAKVVAVDARTPEVIEALDYEGPMFSVQFHPEIMGDAELLDHIVRYLFSKRG